MESLNQRLNWFRNGVYENGKDNKVTREFIAQLLDEVISEYGMEEGSNDIFYTIESRLSKRINARSVAEMKDYVVGDMLLLEEAIKKGFDINRPIDDEWLKENNKVETVPEALDKYYDCITKKADKELINRFYNTNHYEIKGGSYETNKAIAEVKNDVRETLTIKLSDTEEVSLKDFIEKIKNQLNGKMEVIYPNEEEKEIQRSRAADVVSGLIWEYQLKEPRRFASDLASIDFNKLEDTIIREIRRNKDDKSVALVIAESEPYFIKYVNDDLKKDYTVLKEMVKTNEERAKDYIKDDELLKKIKDELAKEEFEKQKQELDSNSSLVNAVNNSLEQEKGKQL